MHNECVSSSIEFGKFESLVSFLCFGMSRYWIVLHFYSVLILYEHGERDSSISPTPTSMGLRLDCYCITENFGWVFGLGF